MEVNKYKKVADYYEQNLGGTQIKLKKAEFDYFIRKYDICNLKRNALIEKTEDETIFRLLLDNEIKKIDKCINEKKLIIIYLIIKRFDRSSHANIIFVQPNRKIINIIEPLGTHSLGQEIKDYMKVYFKKTKAADYEIKHSGEFNKYGPQLIGKVGNKFNGFCFVYSLFITDEWIKWIRDNKKEKEPTLEEIYEYFDDPSCSENCEKECSTDDVCSKRNINMYNMMLEYLKELYEKINYYCYASANFNEILKKAGDNPSVIYGLYRKKDDNFIFRIEIKKYPINDWILKIGDFNIKWGKDKDNKIIKIGDITIERDSNLRHFYIDPNKLRYKGNDYKINFGIFYSFCINSKYIKEIKKLIPN